MQVADDAELPTNKQFRDAIGAHIKWATKIVDEYQAPGAKVETDLPMPRWSWDGLQNRNP